MTHTERISSQDGTSIAWSSTGDGDPVVLVHGNTESAGAWDPIVRRLAPNHRVITTDLRGHGESAMADRYDLEAMAGDVIAVATAAGVERPKLVGHSLGGAVVTAVGAVFPVESVVNVDQSLQLGAFKEQLTAAEALLRDTDSFAPVIYQLFDGLRGQLSDAEFDRITQLRRPDQEVVLGVWELIFSSSVEEINGVVEAALAGYAENDTPYLSIFGVDPGPQYGDWLRQFIRNSWLDVWPDAGHYPHLVDPDRFVDRLEDFWA